MKERYNLINEFENSPYKTSSNGFPFITLPSKYRNPIANSTTTNWANKEHKKHKLINLSMKQVEFNLIMKKETQKSSEGIIYLFIR